MNSNNCIEVNDLHKKFDIKHSTFYGGQAKTGTKQVLNGINFSIKQGEVFGIVGRNGSGKSTLLKILSGIMFPESGTMDIKGKVASILELGMGFEPELPGRDNIVLKCQMYGLKEEEIKQLMDEIVQFSELGEQIDYPLRTYSSGMIAKLAFSVLIHVKCDILIVDEILSVGDAGFNFKCKMIFEKMKKEKKTVIIASHNLSTLENLCDRVMWIENGNAKEIGDAASVCYHFATDQIDSPYTLSLLSESGDITSMNRLGTLYRDGNGIEKDVKIAKNWFKKASDMGNVDAMVNLGDILQSEGHTEEANILYRKAAKLGNMNAILRTYGDNATTIEITNILYDYTSRNNIPAIVTLANALDNGVGLAQDRSSAAKLY